MSDVILDIEDLRTYIPTPDGIVRAVNGVSLSVRHGRTLGILGESGCGKTMTGLSIMRITPDPGRIVDGKILYAPKGGGAPVDIAKLEREGKEMAHIRRREISMIFQEPMTAFSPVYTIGNQITEAIMLYDPNTDKKAARARCLELLRDVGLPEAHQLIDQYPFELSGGMRQRAMIAMALACDPRLLIADEPTTAIDVTIQAQIIELLKSLQQKFGMAIIIITHNLGVIAEMADDVAVMYLGKVVESGTIDDILENPKHPYTQALMRSIPGTAPRHSELAVIPGTVPRADRILPGCDFQPRCSQCLEHCDKKKPGTSPVSDGHAVRCFLYSDVEEYDPTPEEVMSRG